MKQPTLLDSQLPLQEHEITSHASVRMHQRGLCERQIELALLYGRKIHARRAVFHVIGRKEIARFGELDPELNGIQVVTSSDHSTVLTAYRNHDLRAIRPTKRKHRHMH